MKNHIHKIREEALAIGIFLAVIWVIFILDRFLPLEQWGLIPRDLGGLFGIISMSFLHADWQHIVGNSVPLIILLALLAGSRADSIKVVIMVTLLGGAMLWLFGRSSLHIGASLLIFGLASFLVVSGILEKRTLPIMISIGVVLFYGTTLLSGIVPWQTGVSWEGHLFGGLSGAVTAWLLIRKVI